MRSPGPGHSATHPHPRAEPDWQGSLTTLRKQGPKGPDLFTMCPVAFDANSIAPFVLSQRPGWGKKEGRKFFKKEKKRRPGGVPGSWAGCHLAAGALPSLPLRGSPGSASCHPHHLTGLKSSHPNFLIFGHRGNFKPLCSLDIQPSFHATESVEDSLCARHCPRCLEYDSEQNFPVGKKIKQQVAQLTMSATETIRLRGTVRWQLSRDLKGSVLLWSSR